MVQVAAGGGLITTRPELKKAAPDEGVYVPCVRPPGALPWEWTPLYIGKASTSIGERCSRYLDTVNGIFCCDTPPAKAHTAGSSCKCAMFKDAADRRFDVAIL